MNFTEYDLIAKKHAIQAITASNVDGIVKIILEASTELHGKIPIPMILTCPSCSERHIDDGEFADKPHHTHACQSCGMCWRPAIVPTCGVQFLPGFKNRK